MSDSNAHRVGRRAAGNTVVRAVAEVVGKLSTVILLAAIGRKLGQEDLGVFIFAVAYLEITMTPIGFGTDPYLLRQVAASRANLDRLFWNVLAFKAAVAVPVLALGLTALWPLGYDTTERTVVAVLAAGLLLELLAKTYHAVYTAVERNELLASTLVVQRVFTATVGVAALLGGANLLLVTAIYSVGSSIHLGLAIWLLPRAVTVPARRVTPIRWWPLTRLSAPFAAQDILTVLLFKADAVILSLLADESAVGRYGAAYRLIEATMFVGFALNGAFAAMYVYLGRDTDPPLVSVFGRSLKVGLLLLVPIAVVFGTIPGQVLALVFGNAFLEAGAALRLLAPVVVLLCVVAMCTTMAISRGNPRVMLPLTAAMVVVNLGLNAALIPALEEDGAAMAMLVTEAVFGIAALRLAIRETGEPPWATLLAGPLLAGAAMVVPLLVLRDVTLLAILAGLAVYLAVVVAIERRVSPGDLAFAATLIRRRVGA